MVILSFNTHVHRQTDRQSAVALRGEAWCCCFDRLVSPFTLHYHSAEWTASYRQQHTGHRLSLHSVHPETHFGHICAVTATRDYYYRAATVSPQHSWEVSWQFPWKSMWTELPSLVMVLCSDPENLRETWLDVSRCWRLETWAWWGWFSILKIEALLWFKCPFPGCCFLLIMPIWIQHLMWTLPVCLMH